MILVYAYKSLFKHKRRNTSHYKKFPTGEHFFLLPDLTLLRPTLEYCRQWQFWFMLQGSIQGYQRSGKSVSCEAV